MSNGFDRVISSAQYYRLRADAEVEALNTTDAAGTIAMNLVGNDFGQKILGNNAANVLNGLGGNDVIYAYDGIDSLRGGLGNDTLAAGWATIRSSSTPLLMPPRTGTPSRFHQRGREQRPLSAGERGLHQADGHGRPGTRPVQGQRDRNGHGCRRLHRLQHEHRRPLL